MPFVATPAQRRRRDSSPTDEQRHRAALALIERFDRKLRRTARRHSLCADDAEDAYQRAMEILLTKAPVLEPDRLVRWMHTVTRHEAYAVRRQRERLLDGHSVQTDDGDDLSPLDLVASEAPEPDIGVERKERVTRGFEALGALKPQEIRTLTLKAEGYSYEEIGEITGFSRTKINRCMVEGRRSFLTKFAAIEEGERCDQLSAALSAFCDGELADSERPHLLEHLGACSHCRAKLREFRRVPKRVLSLAPVAMLGGPSMISKTGDRMAAVGDRTRELAASVLHRGGAAVDATQTMAAGGGPRGSGLAVLGVVCGLGAAGGGAAVCVDQGVLPSPLDSRSPAVEKQEPAPEPAADANPAAPVHVADPVEAEQASPSVPPAAQRRQELGFEASSSRSPPPSSEFGSPSSSGGGSGAGGSGRSGGGFGFEK